MLVRAIALAEEAHKGQVRKGNGQPYIIHPKRVLKLLQKEYVGWGNDEDMYSAAILHDVLEDCPQISKKLILEQTNEYVLDLVQALTNVSKGSRLHRDVRKEIDRMYLSMAPLGAKIIKLCDRIDNIRDSVSLDRDFQLLYARESMLLCDVLSAPGFKASYICEQLQSHLKEEIYELLTKE